MSSNYLYLFQKVDDARTRAGSAALARASPPDDLGIHFIQQFLQLASRAESGRSLFRCTKKEGDVPFALLCLSNSRITQGVGFWVLSRCNLYVPYNLRQDFFLPITKSPCSLWLVGAAVSLGSLGACRFPMPCATGF